MTTETDQTDRNPTTYTAADGTRYVAVDAFARNCNGCEFNEPAPIDACMAAPVCSFVAGRTDGRTIIWRKVQDAKGEGK